MPQGSTTATCQVTCGTSTRPCSASCNYCSLASDTCQTGSCVDNAQCSTVGGPPAVNFFCTCNSGYQGNPNTGCSNVDECATGTAGCPAGTRCVDTPGSFFCQVSGMLGSGCHSMQPSMQPMHT